MRSGPGRSWTPCNPGPRCHLPWRWLELLRATRSSSSPRIFPSNLSRDEHMAVTENTLILETTQGPVTIEMRPDLAPGHVARIKELVREGFYDGIVFHRVIDGFMAQTGCPHGTGTGGSGKKLKAEFNAESHVRGTVSMARAQDPNSGDSQFFICFDDATFLDKQYTAWGNVVEGMENVDKIKRGEPVRDPDKIVKATIAADEKK